ASAIRATAGLGSSAGAAACAAARSSAGLAVSAAANAQISGTCAAANLGICASADLAPGATADLSAAAGHRPGLTTNGSPAHFTIAEAGLLVEAGIAIADAEAIFASEPPS